MKIQHPLFFLLWSAKLAISATLSSNAPLPTAVISNYPTCIQQAGCLQSGVQSVCSTDLTLACVCQRKALDFFFFLYSCAANSCPAPDVITSINLAANECSGAGYDVNSIINQALVTPTFSYSYSLPTAIPTVSIPTLFNNPSPTGSSSPKTTSGTDNTSTTSKSSGGLSTAAIIGMVVGGVVVIAIIAGLVVFCMKHRAKQQRLNAMTAPPPPPPPAPAGPPPPPMSQYGSPPPPPQGYSPYPAPVYPPQQQPIIQQQQQPLMQGYHELEQPAGFYAPVKEEYSTTPPTTIATPAPLPPGQQGQYFQELPAQERPVQVGQGLAEEGHVYVEMPGTNRS